MISSRFTILLVCLSSMALAACNGGGGSDDDGGSSSQSAAQVAPAVPSSPSDNNKDDDKNEAPDNSQDEDADESQDQSEDDSQDDAQTDTEDEAQDETENQDSGDDTDPVVPEDGDDSEDDVADNDDAPEPGASVVSFRAIADAMGTAGSAAQRSGPPQSGAEAPVTIGQVFARGDVPEGESVMATIDGQSIPTQVDKKATWSDGSLRHAVISVLIPSPSGDSQADVSLDRVDDHQNGSAITLGDVLGTNFDATAQFSMGGQTYRASARDLLSQAQQNGSCDAWGQACKRWLEGPLASEWIVGGPVQANGQTAPNLSVYFNVRAYADASGAVTNVRVDYVVENTWAYRAAPTNLSYNASLSTGAQSYDVSDLTHYSQARWHKVLWWQGAPDVYARLNGDYLQSTGAVSRYADVTPTDDFLDGVRTSVEPMTNGDQSPHMGNTGAQPAIGPLPRWTSTYVVSTDPRAFNWMLANDDAVGSYGFHYRDDETGRPLEITKHPYVTIAAINYARRASKAGYQRDLLPECGGDCDTPYAFDISHHPSIGVVPYLVTGDYYYLEEMQFTGSYVELWANPGYRDGDKGTLIQAQRQVRGQAWGLRSIQDAAFATPDSDPLKPYFKGLVSNILSDYYDQYVADEAISPLHVLNRDSGVVYSVAGHKRVGIAPWQQDFFAWSMGHAAEQENEQAEAISKWLSVFPVARMTNWEQNEDGFCWLQASAYELQIRDSHGGNDYSSVDQAFNKTFPDLVGLKCNSQQMVNLWDGGRYQRGEMYGYAHSPTGFPANFQIALAKAVESGIAGAEQAWRTFAGRSVKPDYSNYPNFAVIPRN